MTTLCALLASLALAASTPLEIEELRERLQTELQTFRNAFLEADDDAEKLRLTQQHSAACNELLAPYCTADGVEALLPTLSEVVGLDLDPSFRALMFEHPDRAVRGRATLAVARYWRRNARPDAVVSKAFLLAEQGYGDLPLDGKSLGLHAQNERYHFEHLQPGRPAPTTVGEDADGRYFDLEDYRGKVVLLRFWGGWCPVCRRMFPYERELVSRRRDAPFALLGVNSDPLPRLRREQRDESMAWRSFWDGGDTAGALATIYQVTTWPTVVVVDHEGIIRFYSRGMPSLDELDRVLDHWLEVAEREG